VVEDTETVEEDVRREEVDVDEGTHRAHPVTDEGTRASSKRRIDRSAGHPTSTD
jgi:hypothetical protein